jgi:hypothetical protein
MVDLEEAGAILLLHDGELADVRELLDELGLGFRECAPRRAAREDYRMARVVLSSPPFLLERLRAGDPTSALRIAILEGKARTLRAMLMRGGVEWLVRRPFHPAALRLLLLHCLYQGPEKRRAARVSVGGAVQFQTGWRKRGALLAEVSERDCRLLADRAVAVGRKLTVRIPQDLAGPRALALPGRVVRNARAAEGDGAHEVCVLFEALSSDESQRLKSFVASHQQGPATLEGQVGRLLGRGRAKPTDAAASVQRSTIPLTGGPGATSAGRGADLEPDAEMAPERRGEARHSFERRVVALGEEATRVLVGRDISLHAMRVDRAPNLDLGRELQIAIHVPGHDTPLVMEVTVDRDDGDRGMLLRFGDLSPTAAVYLRDMLGELPALASTGETGDGSASMVSEIVGSAR